MKFLRIITIKILYLTDFPYREKQKKKRKQVALGSFILERKRYCLQMGSSRIQFNIHIEQRCARFPEILLSARYCGVCARWIFTL